MNDRAAKIELDLAELVLQQGQLLRKQRDEIEQLRGVICDECGLPMPVCSALACYRKAVEYFERGSMIEQGRDMAGAAKAFYEEYLATRPPR